MHLLALLALLVTGEVFGKPSCSTEKNFSKNKEETTCVNLGLSKLPLDEIPKDTAILVLSSNSLKSLSTSSLQGFKDLTELEATDTGMSSFIIDVSLRIEELNLANNSLTAIPEVSKLPGLTTVQLSNNRISTIPKETFTGLTRLTRLELQHNQIHSLDEEVFMDLQSLKHLDLSYNNLGQLPDRLLSNVKDLEILYLTGNRLTEIPDNFFEDLELNYVYLEKNSWNCNCALQYFKNWLEEDEDRVYETSKDGPTKNQRSVVCSDGTPLVDFDMDHCLIRAKGDVDINNVPVHPKITENPKQTERLTTEATAVLPTTTPTTRVTTVLPTTTPTTRVTTVLPTTTPTTLVTTVLPTTTPTTRVTTVLPTTKPTSRVTTVLPTAKPTSRVTTVLPTTTSTTRVTTVLPTPPPTTQMTTILPITTAPTQVTTTLPTTTTQLTTILPTTTQPTQMTTTWSTLVMTTTGELSTTLHVVATTNSRKASMASPTSEPRDATMLPARTSKLSRFGLDWLLKVILEHCCLLHVIIYALCILLLLVWLVITAMCLVWTCCCNRDLLEWLPRIRLIRYSIRVPNSDEDILLVNNGAIESHFRDQSFTGITKMLILESDPQQQNISYTSAIL
ncbi:platelet glycoprotein Ib alpha chain [Engystomops pustulosus]|uniref:platelet glycoprotein Ib alpha chain n=1 Tax=Engystomops pustulosus TaxID=76066 RepID=UPI003AFB6386